MSSRMLFIAALVAVTSVGGPDMSAQERGGAQGRGGPPEPLPAGRRTILFPSRSSPTTASSPSRFASSRHSRTLTASPRA